MQKGPLYNEKQHQTVPSSESHRVILNYFFWHRLTLSLEEGVDMLCKGVAALDDERFADAEKCVAYVQRGTHYWYLL